MDLIINNLRIPIEKDVINEYINNHLDAHKTDNEMNLRLLVATLNLPAEAGSDLDSSF